MITLTQYVTQTLDKAQAAHNATDDDVKHMQAVNDVIGTFSQIGKDIAALLRKGALADIHGEAGGQNVQGEQQKKLDVIANDLLLDALIQNKHCAGVASEELDDAIAANKGGELLVLFDPLDGSSNIDINMPTGTIFSILPYNNQGNPAQNSDFLQKGDAQLASGYLLYGASTILTFTFADTLCANLAADELVTADKNNTKHGEQYNDDGVVMFSLDPMRDEFILIQKNIAIDADTKEYAINGSNYRHWLPPMQQYIDELLAGTTGQRGKNFNTRWVAAMVGDVHRILCRGGIFMYPKDTKDPNKAGKLRLMYEANPMSLLIERAGGTATDAINRIMDYEPTDIHQRVPVVLGSKNEVTRVQEIHEQLN